MRTITTIAELQHQIRAARGRSERIGFVPVHDAVYDGDVERIRTARAQCGFVVVSVITRTQQSAGVFSRFQTQLELPSRQAALAAAGGADLLWLPAAADIDPASAIASVQISASDTTRRIGPVEDVNRLTTQIVRLLGCIAPDVMYLDDVDLERSVLIERTVQDLQMPVQVRRVPALRHPDGCAMSGACAALADDQRRVASLLPQALMQAAEAVRAGTITSVGRLRAHVEMLLIDATGIDVEYVELIDPSTLEPAETLTGSGCLVASVRLDGVRVVDNVPIDVQ